MFNINLKDYVPIYEQLYSQIVRMASLNILKGDEKIPSVRALAKQLKINPNTVQKAYTLLEKDNIIYTIKGKGSFISSNQNASQKELQIIKLEINHLLSKIYNTKITKQDVIKTVEEFYKTKEESLLKGSDFVDWIKKR